MLAVSHHAEELEGVQTDVVIQAYADQILVLITQLGKVGNLVRIRLHNMRYNTNKCWIHRYR